MRTSGIFIIASVLVALGGPAHADGLVIEAHAGERTSDVDYLLTPFYEELAERGYTTPTSGLATKIEAAISQSGDSLPESQIKGAVLLLDRGYEAWITGKFDQAIEMTRNGLDLLLSRPATIARRQSLRDKTFRGYAVLGLAYKRAGDMRNASAAMAQLLRAFPDREYSRKQFGPEGHDLYLQVKAELDRQPKGTLAVEVDDPSTVVFVNGHYTAIGGAQLDQLYPGSYLIYVQKGDTPGRVHEVEIKGGQHVVVDVNWQLDRVLRSRDMVGFRFDEDAELVELSPALATKMAGALGENEVVIVGVRPYEGTESIVAMAVDAESGEVSRKAVLAVRPDAPQADTIRALAAFVDGEPAMAGIRVVGAGDGGGPATDSGGMSTTKIIAGAVGGVGIATLVTGGVLIAIDGNESSPGRVYETMPIGIGLSVAGAAAIGAGVYFWLQADDEPPTRSVAAVPTGDGWFVSFSGLF